MDINREVHNKHLDQQSIQCVQSVKKYDNINTRYFIGQKEEIGKLFQDILYENAWDVTPPWTTTTCIRMPALVNECECGTTQHSYTTLMLDRIHTKNIANASRCITCYTDWYAVRYTNGHEWISEAV
ncbi:PREDICTED: uncharacterized protein LOC108770401 [Trachymyrmex cornetzi]|uniref:uncharacterized protein LOC108770401 n=1 Tax=Trachymyrmex cornetzi TaxID=471704 RepID=UPI00084F3D0D|nr:PREDICTED: uncharacterized protein LOC108770401 [Trachymyrmex cornetzi]